MVSHTVYQTYEDKNLWKKVMLSFPWHWNIVYSKFISFVAITVSRKLPQKVFSHQKQADIDMDDLTHKSDVESTSSSTSRNARKRKVGSLI